MARLSKRRAFSVRKHFNSGFSIVEVLVVVGVLGIVATVAILGFGKLENDVSDSKIDRDIATVNRAISVYLSNGGSLDGIDDPQVVIDKLKTVRSDEASRIFVGAANGSVVASDLNFVLFKEGEQRFGAKWDSSQMKFVSATGDGSEQVGEFDHRVNGTEGEPEVEERKSSSVTYSKESGWIWDYTEATVPEAQGPTDIAVVKVDDPGIPPPTVPPVTPPVTEPPVEEPDEEPEESLKKVKITFTQNSGSAWALNTAHIIVNGQAQKLGDSDGGSGNTTSVEVVIDTDSVTEIGLAVFTIGRLKKADGSFVFAGGSGYSVNTSNGDTIQRISPGASFEGKSSARAKFKSFGNSGNNLNIEVGVEDAFALDQSVFGVDYDYNDFCFSIKADKPFPVRFAGLLIE